MHSFLSCFSCLNECKITCIVYGFFAGCVYILLSVSYGRRCKYPIAYNFRHTPKYTSHTSQRSLYTPTYNNIHLKIHFDNYISLMDDDVGITANKFNYNLMSLSVHPTHIPHTPHPHPEVPFDTHQINTNKPIRNTLISKCYFTFLLYQWGFCGRIGHATSQIFCKFVTF